MNHMKLSTLFPMLGDDVRCIHIRLQPWHAYKCTDSELNFSHSHVVVPKTLEGTIPEIT